MKSRQLIDRTLVDKQYFMARCYDSASNALVRRRGIDEVERPFGVQVRYPLDPKGRNDNPEWVSRRRPEIDRNDTLINTLAAVCDGQRGTVMTKEDLRGLDFHFKIMDDVESFMNQVKLRLPDAKFRVVDVRTLKPQNEWD